MSEGFEVSAALTLYLKHYPGRNDIEFDEALGPDAGPTVRAQIRELLNEAMRIEPDWDDLSLKEAGEYVATVMDERHPDLSPEALTSIATYVTYLTR